MINSSIPKNWHDLQSQVSSILSECGFNSCIDQEIILVRGKVNVDVFAIDNDQNPPSVYICECKLWAKKVSKNVIHSFRTILADSGANWGLIISSKGFHKGAYDAIYNSNLRLLTWLEFQELFVNRWANKYMIPKLHDEADAIIQYTEDINSRIIRKADNLSPKLKDKFRILRNKNYILGSFIAVLIGLGTIDVKKELKLPLKNYIFQSRIPAKYIEEDTLPKDIFEATSLRDLLEILLYYTRNAIADFDDVFGERA